MSNKIQNLLEQANHSAAEDSSVTLAGRSFLSEDAAVEFFNQTKQKLFNLEIWDENSTPSSYELFDENGNLDDTKIIDAGKFMRINVHGSGKYDWVKVIEIYDDSPDEFVIRVKPTYDPTARPVDKSVTSHFFTSEATNNFCLQRDDKTVTLYVIGLDEKANIKETDSTIESIRNAATANLGYYFGMQKMMWKDFCKNFLETEK